MATAQSISPLEDEPSPSSGESAEQTRLLVLSRDVQLVDTVRRAAPRNMPLTQAANLDRIAEQLLSLHPGILLIDTESTADAASMLSQLTQHFPELVVVVAGKREDSAALMQLTAAGRIFRFLLTPLSHGQARLALEAAALQHAELVATGRRLSGGAGAGGRNRNYVATYGALAAGLLVAIGAIWTGVKMFTAEPTSAPAVVATPVPTNQLPGKPDPLQAELALAKTAFDQNRYIEPQGESALDFYRSALAIDPNSEAAKAGVRAVADRILERAETELTAERIEEAVRNIETARDIDATHPRLKFLDVQIARENERHKLSQARDVGNRIRALVAQANSRMQDGRLITPEGSSARDSLAEARRIDPADPTVAQGFRELNTNLTEAARVALTEGKKDEAQALVNAARQLGSAGPALAQVERALADASRPPPAAPVVAEAPRRQVTPPPVVAPEPAPAATMVREAPAETKPAAAATRNIDSDTVVQAGTLPRIREVAAKYPPKAQIDGVQGWVDIDFTISREGLPEELKVRESRPRQIFDRAALASVQQWRFKPIERDGVAVPQRATLRVRFELK